MQRYFVTRWASIILGTGAFFVALGLVIFADDSLIIPTLSGTTTVDPLVSPIVIHQDLWGVPFSLIFYGGLQMAIGISVLLLQRFRRQKSRDAVLLTEIVTTF